MQSQFNRHVAAQEVHKSSMYKMLCRDSLVLWVNERDWSWQQLGHFPCFYVPNDISQHHFDSMLQHHLWPPPTHIYISISYLVIHFVISVMAKSSWSCLIICYVPCPQVFLMLLPSSACVIIKIRVHLEAQVVALLRRLGTWFTITFGKVLIWHLT